MTIAPISKIDGIKYIAIMDTSSLSFLQGLSRRGVNAESILKDYELILIPEWVLAEIRDSEGRAEYLQLLIDKGFPIHSIAEERYSLRPLEKMNAG